MDELLRDLRTMAAFSREQREALCGEREMTQEMFENALEVCIRTNNDEEFIAVLEQFPTLSEAFVKLLEEENRMNLRE